MVYKEVTILQKRPDKYIYHGKNEIDRVTINHGTRQRHVIEIAGVEWPATSPEECTDDGISGDWYRTKDREEYLLCPGCGLDCT